MEWESSGSVCHICSYIKGIWTRPGQPTQEHEQTPILSPISLDGAVVMDLLWPPLFSSAQCNHTAKLEGRLDDRPSFCQHLHLKNGWD